jgi:hypothetical protein
MHKGVIHLRRERTHGQKPCARGRVELAVMLLLCLLCLSLRGGGAAAAGGESELAVKLSVQDGLMSAHVEQVPLGAVLQELARQAQLNVHITKSDAQQPVSAKFEALPLEEGIKRLLRGKNYGLTTAPIPGAAGRSQGLRIVEIKVLSRGEPYETLTRGKEAELNPTQEEPQASAELSPDPEEPRASPDKLRRDALKALDGRTREAAVYALGDQEDVGAHQDVLVTALQDPDPHVRSAALDTLASRFGPVVFDHLTAVAQHDESLGLRREALTYLGELGKEAVRPQLEQALQDPELRGTAQRLIEWIAEESAQSDQEGGDESKP